LAVALEQEQDKDHISAILGEFCAFAKAIEANLKDADLQCRIKILRLLIKQIEVSDEEICVVYKVSSCPFDQGPVTGHFQNRSRRKTVAIPVEDLETITTPIDEQEQVTGGWILGKGVSHQPGERIKTFAEVSGMCVKEHSDGMREADHLEPPELALAPARARTRRQANRTFAVGMRRRIPLGRSASIGACWWASRSTRRTVTGRKSGWIGGGEL
jgi:hypothetical protein